MERNEIMVIYGEDILAMTKKICEEAKLAERIPAGAKIGLKPNLVVAARPETGATTHAEILEGCIQYLQEHGQKDITIIEGSWVGDQTSRAFKVVGYDKLSRKYNVSLFDTKYDKYERRSYGGVTMEISKTALDLDFLISMPVLKGHCQTIVTGALKNMKGILSDREKRHFHSMGLHKPIAYLNKIYPAHFILGDGICGDLDFEEGGNPVQMNRIFCGLDPVLVDTYICQTMGYEPTDIPYIRIANEIGVGSIDLKPENIIELNKDTSKVKPTSSRKVARLAKNVREKDACSACYANLIQACARLDDRGLLGWLNKTPICIGQGYRGESGTNPGIGNCTRAFDTHCAGCPPKTPEILAYLEEYISRG
ncbi:MAG: DUF362 domain-containing protein [Lachnospiraceae bacterium]|nr:DUF362 domain-containing protein [Lachnospiraceae bacterium]